MRVLFAPLALFVLLAASPASAWPVDLYVDLEVGKEKFERLPAVEWLQVEDPKIATAERLHGTEVLLTGAAPGRTLLLFYAEGKFGVLRLRVAPKGGKAPVLSAELPAKACSKIAFTGQGEERTLTATVATDGCRRALLSYFEQDAVSAHQVELTFEVPALQAQLSAIQAALPAPLAQKVSLRYLGAGLVLEGNLTEEQHRAVLWTLFRHSVGRVALDDRVEERKP